MPVRWEVRFRRMIVAGAATIVLGIVIHLVGLNPLVKRIWTPSWTLFSGGCCFILLAAFHAALDWKGWRRWAFPLEVIGLNSIAAYCAAHLFENFVSSSLTTHFGLGAFTVFGEPFAPFLRGVLVLVILWLMLYWMYRRKIFLKI